MTTRRVAAVLVVLVLIGCSGSDDDPELVPDTTPVSAVSDDELRNGVFEQNDGETEPGSAPASSVADGAPADADTDPTSTVVPADARPVTDDGDDATGGASSSTGGSASTSGTTSGSGASDSGTGGTGTGTTGTGGGATSGSGTGGTTGGTDGTSGSTGSTGDVEALTGAVTIGDETYAFRVDECDVADTTTSASGDTALDGTPFIVRVTSNIVDIDEDGEPDTTIQIDVDTDGEGGDEAVTLVGMRSATLRAAFDVDFSVTTDRIRATGLIVDPSIGDTVPMVLDIRCA